MLRIKRVKGPPAPATTPPAIHYALSVAKAGNVTGWTADVAEAALFPDGTAALVRAFYLRRENAGTLSFEGVPEPVKPVPVLTAPVTPAPPVCVAPVVPEPAPERPKQR